MSSQDPTENVAGKKETESASAPGPTRKGGPLSGTLGVVIFLVLFATAAYLAYDALTTAPTPEIHTPEVVYMCAETNKTFMHMPVVGEMEPVESPYTKRKTGFRPEACYWTKDGKQKTKPTYVILSERLGKTGATICPDCGRLVLPHNDPPPIDTPLAIEGADTTTTQPTERPSDEHPAESGESVP